MVPALVLAQHGGEVVVETGDGKRLRCATRRRLGTLVAGDRVEVLLGPAGSAVVTEREPRRSALQRRARGGRTRAVAANLDQIVVVLAPLPAPLPSLIDRYLVAAALAPARPLLVLNKIDLPDAAGEAAIERLLEVYRAIGITVARVSATRAMGLDGLRGLLAGKASVIVGQSGVGKSSLVEALLPGTGVRTAALSQASGEGRHTTRTSTLFHLPEGGLIIDSPGVRGFEPPDFLPADADRGFPEIRALAGDCRFANCRHVREPGCAVLAALAEERIDPGRYASYRRLLEGEAGG